MSSTELPRLKLAVAASFTAEPLADSLAFWSEKLQWKSEVEFAAYNQVFQQLLDPASLFGTNRKGANIVLVRPEDWVRYGHEANAPESSSEKLLSTARELTVALRGAAQRSAVPYLVCVCPPSPAKVDDSDVAGAEELICSSLRDATGVHVFSRSELQSFYPVASYYDADRDEMGHIPYTAEFFAVLGTIIARRLNALQQPPYKVIAVDCDETLWAGVCGEVGPMGIEIDAGRKAFQEFLVQQRESGMLLCLCSKNNPEDVDEVFRLRTDMPLKREHITAARVNWNPKAGNLLELADDLQLGLDSFVFIDDNPLECGQVKAAHPEVLTLSLPTSSAAIPQFLANVWAFDKFGITEEDRKRSEYYRQNRERDEFQQQAPSLEKFLAGLDLKTDISPLVTAQLARASQLTQRTNQFNCTTLRRSEDEVGRLWTSGEREWLTVTVSDRFGDYGLVGVLAFCATQEALDVDTFLLSCRVLGRGVEHRMLRKLGEIAEARSLSSVCVQFVPSKKNAPALTFLEAVAAQYKQADGKNLVFRIPAGHAAGISESQILATAQAAADAVKDQQSAAKPPASAPARSELIQEIASQLADAKSIAVAIRTQKTPAAEGIAKAGAPLTPEEQVVADVWVEVLGVSDLNSASDFFALGGDSLLATQVISRLRQITKVRLHLHDIFESSSIAALAACIQKALATSQKLTPAAASRVEAKLEQAKSSRDTGEILRRQKDQSACALSFGQQRWWFLNQWAPGTADHLSLVLRLKGELNLPALQRALDAVTERHEVLRTRYKLVDGNPLQVIAPAAPVHLAVVDLQHLSEAEREQEAAKICEQQFRQAFDLSSEPILRPTLLKLSPNDHALVLVMHHIASDGWARGVLMRELESFYTAFTTGQQPALPELPVQYADYSLWQRERMAKGGLDEQLAFYKKALAGAPAVLELPTDRPRPSVQDLRGGVHIRIVPKELLDRLQHLSQKEGATLFMTLLAAYQVLLYRYSGQEDLVVGSPAAGRNHPSVEGLIGCFINMVVFRGQLRADESFSDLLARVRTNAVAAQENQDLPFERLVEEIQRGRDMSRAPIFQVMFALETLLPTPRLPHLAVELREEETRTSFHDLSLFVAPQKNGLRVRFEYRTDLFTAEYIERMAAHFETLLASIASSPEKRVGEMPMLPASEMHRLLVEFNDTRVEYPLEKPLTAFIEEQVRRSPDATALVYEDQKLTYAELNERANQLARRLISHGVGPDVLVGVCIERSLEMVIALLGTMKAGGAYVPFDPEYPQHRLEQMLKDADPPVMLTVEELLPRLPKGRCHVMCLDRDHQELAAEPTSDLPVRVTRKDLAYAIFTSGSTGRPKGVPNTHEGIVNRLLWMQDQYKLTPRDRVLQKTPYSFDVSVWEFFWPLMTGATLVMARPGGHRDVAYLIDVIADQKITTLHFVPSMLSLFLEGDGLERCRHLRQVFASGEALPLDLQQRFFEKLNVELHNLYGPTEAAVDVTYWRCRPGCERISVPIGRPIANIQIYILDPLLQPVPIGVAGELHIGGIGLARGYLNKPELTAEKFIQNPYGKPGDRLYKTGDLARFLSDGNIEYLGRIDHQVKLRGFRIELGEIEVALAQYPGVQQTIVLLREDRGGNKQLVAYVVPQAGEVLSQEGLLASLKDKLPEYMVPSGIVFLECMPLGPNGKIDRRALPEPEFGLPQRTHDFAPPRTPLEVEVANVWKQVLGIEQVGIDENLFEVGGHSLVATRMIMLLHNRLGINLPFRRVFENPTIEGMASALTEALLDRMDEKAGLAMITELENLSDEEVRQLRTNSANLRRNGVAAS